MPLAAMEGFVSMKMALLVNGASRIVPRDCTQYESVTFWKIVMKSFASLDTARSPLFGSLLTAGQELS
ncbi:hypothetical protein KVR01_011549 [Diaporthe batatas]|uniref:uncharacterized protein n=1 Tax=Diaporthe batatas TaxID=748121 RepID=UPI001D05B785|nr:uncharacterized protein KVR01_011549 [Diaporthe batatas]KAG8158427.1 hypothetical protein KVR01_011549 [Diaporthe batatas]